MNIIDLVTKYPVLFHMAESGSWESIQKNGLRSTIALLDLFEISKEKRISIEQEHRPKSVKIEHPIHGIAIIRDQKPMPPEIIRPLLKDITVQESYKLLNGKTFLWAQERRFNTLLNAVAYRNRSHTVISFNTKRLLERYADKIHLTDMNTGFAYSGGYRNRSTFKSIGEFPTGKVVWEVAIDYIFENISDFAFKVEERKRDQIIGDIWTYEENKPPTQ